MRLTDVLYEADGPLDEEKARALAVNEVIREPLSEYLDEQQSKRRLSVGVGVGGVLIGIVTIVAGVGVATGGGLILAGLLLGSAGFIYTTNQAPDITVTSVEKGYWTAHTIPDKEGVVVYDATKSVEKTSFDLERLRNQDTIASVQERLGSLGEFPVVMAHDRNVEKEFTRTLEEIQSEIDGAERRTVKAPVIPADSPEAKAIDVFATGASRTNVDDIPVDTEIEASEAVSDVETLANLERIAVADEGEAELEQISSQSRELVGDLSNSQETAIELLNDHIGTAADEFGRVSYNFYCPDCQIDEIDSAVELTDPKDGEWHCDTCRSHHETEEVIPRHRIKDDIVNPVWDQLWIEKDDQRREIYENIEDQKAELQEREFEQRREEIRSATDRIRDLRSRIRDLKTEAKAAEGTVEEIGDLMVKYDRIHQERKQEFQREVEESFAEIDEETDRILEETQNEEQERIEKAQQAAKKKAKQMREDERRRQVQMFMAAQKREDQRVQAQMAQQAQLHDESLEVEKQHHREDWLLETRGRTSFSGLINKSKMKKDRLLGASVRNGGEK